jgi:hypothetical protein
MHAEHALGRFKHGGFTCACRVMAAVLALGNKIELMLESCPDDFAGF